MTDTESLGSELMELGRFYYEREGDYNKEDIMESLEQIIQREKTSNEMNILREFVEEFSPIHVGQVGDFTYDELFDVVADIMDTHYARS